MIAFYRTGSELEDVLLRAALGLACTGRPEQALDFLEKARRADPTSASDLRTIYSGYAYAWSGQYDRAIEIFNHQNQDVIRPSR
jgi:tetratricopeptide (TPR) repeat protein